MTQYVSHSIRRTEIHDAVRTPFGRAGGALSGIRPDDLAATVVRASTERLQLDPAHVDDVILGAANQAGEDNRNVARLAALLAGFPTTVTGSTVNRLCASSLEAVVQGARAIEAGDADLVIAGGVESMSRAPFVMEKSAKAWPTIGNQTLWNTTIGWRMVNRLLPTHWTVSNGEAAELWAGKLDLDREAQDQFAYRSHQLAAAAWEAGIYASETVGVAGIEMARDEGIRADTSLEKLSQLPALFAHDERGTVTAGNSSPISDGASAVVLTASGVLDTDPLAVITARALHGVEPQDFPIAPIEAANKALARAGRSWSDVDFVELNEAFASQCLACLKGWPELDPERLNIHGGAIAIGHPLGASGGRIVGHAAHELARRGSGIAVVAICIGVGQGMALVLER